jgi:hypothetical protein
MSDLGWPLLVAIVAIVVTLGIAGCSFGRKNFRQEGGVFAEPNSFVIQIGDYGKYWPPKYQRARSRQSSEKRRTVGRYPSL